MQQLGLNEEELAIVGECLRAAVKGPFFPEWEFQSLIGWSRAEVHGLADTWPSPSVAGQDLADMVVAVLNNLVGFPHGQGARWSEFISVTRQRVADLLGAIAERRRREAAEDDA